MTLDDFSEEDQGEIKKDYGYNAGWVDLVILIAVAIGVVVFAIYVHPLEG